MQFVERKRRKLTIQIVSLVDVVFLLLIFFSISATFMDQPAIKLNLPEASAEPLKQQPKDIMTVYLNSEGDLYFGDRQIKLDDLPDLLKKGLAEGRPPQLTVKADRDVIYGKAIEVIDKAHQYGIEKVTMSTQQKARAKQN